MVLRSTVGVPSMMSHALLDSIPLQASWFALFRAHWIFHCTNFILKWNSKFIEWDFSCENNYLGNILTLSMNGFDSVKENGMGHEDSVGRHEKLNA